MFPAHVLKKLRVYHQLSTNLMVFISLLNSLPMDQKRMKEFFLNILTSAFWMLLWRVMPVCFLNKFSMFDCFSLLYFYFSVSVASWYVVPTCVLLVNTKIFWLIFKQQFLVDFGRLHLLKMLPKQKVDQTAIFLANFSLYLSSLCVSSCNESGFIWCERLIFFSALFSFLTHTLNHPNIIVNPSLFQGQNLKV